MKCLFKFDKNISSDAIVIDTTSNSGEYSELSPFILSGAPAYRFENLWQFSKVYKCHLNEDGWMTQEWYQWQANGFHDVKAHRYPMGKGAIPEFTYWGAEKLGYIDARKQLYAKEYARNVYKTKSYTKLKNIFKHYEDKLILLDYDAYDHRALGMNLIDVMNNSAKKMGHAFVLMMMLQNVLDICINSPTGVDIKIA